MRYFGGKNRIAKRIRNIMQPYIDNACAYVEPFVGGASVMCEIDSAMRIGSDSNAYLIHMWNALCNGWEPPQKLSKEEYQRVKLAKNERDPLTAFAGFGCSFSGKWFGGYARSTNERNYAKNAYNSLKNKRLKLNGVTWVAADYRKLAVPNNSVIYCDPPYQGTTQYGACEPFCWHTFWEWCRKKTREGNVVFVSEYSAPDDFTLIANIDTYTDIRTSSGREKRIEKLFTYCAQQTEGKRTMNAIVHKRFESPAAMASYAHVLARAADAIPVGSGGLPILKLVQEGKDAGYFNFGEDATEVSDDDLWAINPYHILRGYICFSSKNEVLGEVLRPITAEPVDYDKLPVHYGRDKRGKEIELEWQAQIVLHMQCIAGPNEGASVVFKPVSGGGLKLCRTILHEIARRLAKGTDKPVPTGFLSAYSYKAKTYGNKTVWNPLFEFDKWVDMEFADAEAAPMEDAETPAEEERKPATRSRSRDADDAEIIEDEPKRGRGTRDRDNNPKDYDGTRATEGRRGGEDDDAEEAPKRGRGRPKKEVPVDDDEPRGRERSRRDDEVYDQDEEGNPRRSRRQDAEEGTRKRGEPAPRRGRGRDEDDDAPRGRERGGRGRDRDEDDDAPRSRSRR